MEDHERNTLSTVRVYFSVCISVEYINLRMVPTEAAKRQGKQIRDFRLCVFLLEGSNVVRNTKKKKTDELQGNLYLFSCHFFLCLNIIRNFKTLQSNLINI